MKVKPVLWPKQSDDGTYPIKIYIYINGEKDYKHTDYSIYKNFWDKNSSKVKDSHPNADLYNGNIQALVNKIEKKLLAGQSIENAKKTSLDSSGSSLIDFITNFIADCKSGKFKRAPATITTYNTNLDDLKEYGKLYGVVDFDTINKTFYDNYVGYFREGGEDWEPLGENTIGNKIKFIKMILTEAVNIGITNTTEHTKKYFKKPTDTTDSIALNEEKIEKIINVDLTHFPHLLAERDRWIISYFFLLRFGDSLLFDESNFYKENEIYYLRLHAEKTTGLVVIPTKPFVYTLLVKYKFKLPATTNQESNWKIKEIGRLAGITNLISINGVTKPEHEFITTHTARRSGATNLYLQGVPEKIIMDLGGWKKVETFRTYIRIKKLESAKLASNYDFYK